MSTRGARLTEAMAARGWRKQYALAVALGVNESNITRWKENGPMSVDNAISLCRQLDISLDWFLTGVGSMDQHKFAPAAAVPEADVALRTAFARVSAALSDESRTLLISLIDSILGV